MELHSHLHPSVDDGLDKLPQDLYQAEPLGVCVYFCYQEKYHTAKICWECAVSPQVLNQSHQFIPAGRVRWISVPIRICLPQPPLEVFSTDMGVSSRLVTTKPAYQHLKICLHWSLVINLEVGSMDWK